MKTLIIPLVGTLFALVACNEPTTSNPPSAPPANTPQGGTPVESGLTPQRDSPATTNALTQPADNSGRNQREDGTKLTPMDQGENEADRTITASIRAAVMDREELSTNAKNVKIITSDGKVTLRGPVTDQRERTTIGGIATSQPGVRQVDNQLEPLQQ